VNKIFHSNKYFSCDPGVIKLGLNGNDQMKTNNMEAFVVRSIDFITLTRNVLVPYVFNVSQEKLPPLFVRLSKFNAQIFYSRGDITSF
jgi:hypothetical protein